ncbi:1-acyl-sn-glycerol-3-phosphate acyltransferase [Flavobacterium sp. SM2513]|uniref:1-acyl-sn-glycerol-3-phosphate acyltransferase n=1 Tax=Flavobacterium sp. SM2513 TaxID=3424766 RepID=UPI003D7FD663
MKKKIYKWIFSNWMGWKIRGTMDAAIQKSVIMVVPHTSWHDFYIGLITRGVLGLEMNYVAKKELFVFPFNFFFKWMGGAPLDRSATKNTVESIATIFNQRKIFRLAISPEGTRKKVTEWKTGFYYIALKAGVPIIPVAFDYTNREVVLHPAFYPTGFIEADFEKLKLYFTDVKGKIPENSF